MALTRLAQAGAAGGGDRGRRGDPAGPVVHHLPRGGRRPGTDGAVALDRDERPGRRGLPGGLARHPLVAARGGGAGDTALRPVCGHGAQRLGGLLPHGTRRVESTDVRAVARPDRPASGHRNAGRRDQADQGRGGAGGHRRQRFSLRPPPGTGLSASRMVQQQSATSVTGGHDGQLRLQYPGRLAGPGRRLHRDRQLRRRTPRVLPGAGVRRSHRFLRQRHRVRQRHPRQRRRSSDEGHQALHGVELRCQR